MQQAPGQVWEIGVLLEHQADGRADPRLNVVDDPRGRVILRTAQTSWSVLPCGPQRACVRCRAGLQGRQDGALTGGEAEQGHGAVRGGVNHLASSRGERVAGEKPVLGKASSSIATCRRGFAAASNPLQHGARLEPTSTRRAPREGVRVR